MQDGIYKLQRRAFEAHGQGCWKYLEQEIPITLDGENLRELPVESSLVFKSAESPRFTRRMKLKKTGTDISEETLPESIEKKSRFESSIRIMNENKGESNNVKTEA